MFVKDIVERDTPTPTEPSASAPRPPVPQLRGFPVAAHRSKGTSAFARARKDDKTRAGGRLVHGEGRIVDSVPAVGPSSSSSTAFSSRPVLEDPPEPEYEVDAGPSERDAVELPALTEAEQVRRQVHRENLARVESMSQEEREQEAAELRERFGDKVVELMRKRRAAREPAGAGREGAGPRLIRPPNGQGVFEGGAGLRSELGMGTSAMGMGDMDDTGLRSTEDDMGPRKPEPRAFGDDETLMADIDQENRSKVERMSQAERDEEMRDLEERFGSALLGRLKAQLDKRSGRPAPPSSQAQPREDEAEAKPKPSAPSVTSPKPVHEHPTADRGASKAAKSVRFDAPTPSQLKKYFPDAPASDPKLEWMTNPAATTSAPPPSQPDEDPNAPRFDLSGAPLSAEDAAKLPTHLGLHHHGASPDLAGYTLSEIVHLCYSTVASQRIAMMGVLGRVVRNYRKEVEYRKAAKPALAQETSTEAKDSAMPTDEEKATPQDWVEACTEADVEGKAIAVSAGVLASPTRAISVIAAAVDLLFTSLGGPWPYLDSPPVSFHPTPTRDGEPTGIASLPWDDLAPRLAELLSADLPVPTLTQLLRILRRAAVATPALAEAVTPIVPHIVKAHVLRPAWPAANGGPNPDALALLREVIDSSREAAEALVPTGETLLRFLATDVPDDAASKDVILQVLGILYSLGRYGMAAGLAASARDVWHRLGKWVSSITADESEPQTQSQSICIAYYDLLRVWTVCAVDPHRTTPEHDLTWSQLTAMGITDEALSGTRALLNTGRWRELASTLGVLAEYAIGAGINGVRGGADEKAALLSSLQEMGLVDSIPSALADLPADTSLGFNAALTEVFRLNNALGYNLIESPVRERLVWWSVATTASTPEDVYLRHALLETAAHEGAISLEMWAKSAFDLALNYMPGDEPLALGLIDDLIRADWTGLVSDSDETDEAHDDDHDTDRAKAESVLAALKAIDHKDGLQILRPLLHQSVLPSLTDILAPRRPAHLYLKASGTLRSPPPPTSEQHVDGLPLHSDWVFSPLDELLSSGSSEALALAPSDWDASEPQLVRATLALARISHLTLPTPGNTNRSSAILGCMKVFMLEHGLQDSPNAVGDVFRDDAVHASLEALLDAASAPATSGATTSQTQVAHAPLETAARSFLKSTPFFQFYQDLVALFEAVSFGDAAFARTLLPPLAMNYDVDYRRLLWAESGALRSMRFGVASAASAASTAGEAGAMAGEAGAAADGAAADGVPLETGSVAAFFHPLETDRGVLAAYARALVSGTVQDARAPFLVRLAVHHVAGLLWTGEETARESPRVQVLVMVLAQGSDEVLRRVMAHDVQSVDGRGTVGEEEVARRVKVIGELTGPRGVVRLKAAGYAVA